MPLPCQAPAAPRDRRAPRPAPVLLSPLPRFAPAPVLRWARPGPGIPRRDNWGMRPAFAGSAEEHAGRLGGWAAPGPALPEGPRYPRFVQAMLYRG